MSERALVDDASLRRDDVTLTGDRAHHLARVTRVRPGERVTLFDGAGFERDAEVTRVDAREVSLRCVSPRRPGVTADAARVTWLQGVPKVGSAREGVCSPPKSALFVAGAARATSKSSRRSVCTGC